MGSTYERKLSPDEAKFNLLARFGDDPRAHIEQRDNSLHIHFSCNGQRPYRKGSLTDLRYAR